MTFLSLLHVLDEQRGDLLCYLFAGLILLVLVRVYQWLRELPGMYPPPVDAQYRRAIAIRQMNQTPKVPAPARFVSMWEKSVARRAAELRANPRSRFMRGWTVRPANKLDAVAMRLVRSTA